MSSYLSDRTQCVKVDGLFSGNITCTIDVSQGFVLGPLLFSLHISDLPSVCHGIDLQMYADDTVLYTHAKTAELAARKLTVVMERITEWLDQSCLSLNISKTKGMFFSKTKESINADIYIKAEKIEIVSEIKYLGVLLDSNLNFKSHIKKMTKTIKYNLANFRHIR